MINIDRYIATGYAYSSTDNFLSPILISDWLIFCCENLIRYQKKETKDDKNTIFDKNDKKKAILVNVNIE